MATSPTLYRLTVVYFPTPVFELSLDLGFSNPEKEKVHKPAVRIDVVVAPAPEWETLQLGNTIDLKLSPGPFGTVLKVQFLSYEPETTGARVGAMSMRPLVRPAPAEAGGK